MKEYLGLVRKVLAGGKLKKNRTGVDTLSLFGQHLEIPVDQGLPLVTTKKMNFRSIVAELLWFISGENHPRNLQKHTKIWDPWVKDGDLDSIYGFYWRKHPSVANGAMVPDLAQAIEEGFKPAVGNVDQLAWVVGEIARNRNSRRLLVTAVDPANFHRSNLPPCHDSFVFNCLENKLNLQVRMRSVDLGIGLPFNITSYALLLLLVCREVGIAPGVLQFSLVDCHIYINHINQLGEQTRREPFFPPEVELPNKSLLKLDLTDLDSIRLLHYQHHEEIRLPVNV
jgi:thymidylate synthase